MNEETADRLFMKMCKLSIPLDEAWSKRGITGGDRYFIEGSEGIEIFTYTGSTEDTNRINLHDLHWLPKIDDIIELVKDTHSMTIDLIREFAEWANLNEWSHEMPTNFCWLMYYMRTEHQICFDLQNQTWVEVFK